MVIRGAAPSRVILLLMLAVTAPAQAQVQRTLINLGFEQPALGTATCYRILNEAVVPGWTTNHPTTATETTTCNGINIPGATTSGPAMEFWANNFNSTPAREGTQHVELNASAVSQISQSVCLVNGESVNWVFSHRGRGSDTVPDVMDYLVGSSPIVRASTTATGTGGVVSTSLGTATSALASNGWRDYSGSFTYTGATGATSLSFNAISTGSGSATVGNFLDRIQISLRPFVEFVSATETKAENTAASTANLPRIRVTGTVPAGGMTVAVNITGGTATMGAGADYTTTSGTTALTITIPAGVYDGNSSTSEFAVPVTLVSDAVPEANETVIFNLPAPGGSPAYLLSSTTTCGGSVITTSTLTITDTVARVALAKTVASRPPSGTAGFTVGIAQNSATIASASTTTASTSASTGVQLVTSGVAVTLSDTMLAGSTLLLNQFDAGIACTNSASGSATVLPSGISTTGTWTFTPAVNDNVSCTITNTAKLPTLSLAKTVGGRANAADQFTVAVRRDDTSATVGSATTSGAGTSASTGALTLPSLSPAYSIVDTMAAGSVSGLTQYATSASCSNSRPGGIAVPTVTNTGTGTWTVSYVAGDVISCTITNTPAAAQFTFRKALAGSRLSASDQFRMTIAATGGGTGAGAANSTGTGSTVGAGSVTANPATINTLYTLSEAMVAGSASPLASYAGSIACTNTRTGGATTTLPSGAGTSFTLTPLAGDNITCTLTNTPGTPVLTVGKSDGATTYTPGGTATYTITIGNTGSAIATAATVADTLPNGVTLTGAWSCSATAGSSCSAASGGTTGGSSVSLTVTVAVGGTVTITVPVAFSALPGAY